MVPNLKSIIKDKIKYAKEIKNELSIAFKETNKSTKNDKVIVRFKDLLMVSKDFTLKDIQNYILVPNFEKIAMINNGVKRKKKLDSEIKESVKIR